jgi:hypothetical protein
LNNNLAPTYQRLFGAYWVLWYKTSNSYSIVESEFKTLLDNYLQAKSIESFANTLAIENDATLLEPIIKNISVYLKDCNIPYDNPKVESKVLDVTKRNILKHYVINGKTISVYYDSELLQKIFHTSLAHLSKSIESNAQITFDIYVDGDQLLLFKNGILILSAPKKDYHLVQGTFLTHLLSHIHNTTEDNWLAAFHGSTITNDISSILFVGQSGKGKSTLCSLLASSGLQLIADDLSPMISGTNHIYYNPSAISIKQGSFSTISPHIELFEELPTVQLSKRKGLIKYIPSKHPKKNSYPCKAVILVNYQKDADTILEEISIKTLLEALISDSWLSPNPIHAREILNWLEALKIFKLTYSNTESVTKEVYNLFQQLDKL